MVGAVDENPSLRISEIRYYVQSNLDEARSAIRQQYCKWPTQQSAEPDLPLNPIRAFLRRNKCGISTIESLRRSSIFETQWSGLERLANQSRL